MKTKILGIALAALVLSASAYADAILTPDVISLPGGMRITFLTNQSNTMLVNGFALTNRVQFSSSQDLNVKLGVGRQIDPANGKLHDITIMSPGNIFTGLLLDAFQASTMDVQVVATMSDGKTFTSTMGGASGHDYMRITTIDGEMISNVSIMSTAGFNSLKDVRIAGIAPAPSPVPEPSSILLLGSGLLVFTQVLRRKSKADETRRPDDGRENR